MSRTSGMSTGEVARKLVHIGAGGLALLVPWLTWWQGALICAAAFAANWLLLPVLTRRRLEREDERRRGYAAGIIIYPLSVGALFVLFGSVPPVVAAAWAILAFGDGCATLAGRILGGPRLPWSQAKTYAGLAAFVVSGGLAGSALWVWTESADPSRVPDPVVATVLCFAAAALAALVESSRTGLNDNFSVPMASGSFLFAASFVSVDLLSERASWLQENLIWAAAVNALVGAAAWAARTVSLSGALAGTLIGVTIYTFGGWRAFAILLLFFVLGSAATKLGYQRKAARNLAQEGGGRRRARHAVANCGMPALLAFLHAATDRVDLVMVAFVAALATASWDTVSSEMGQLYGRRAYLITSLRRVPPGTEGAVSIEGSLAGLVAASLIGAASMCMGMFGALGPAGGLVAVAAAFLGTTAESYLGATLGAAGTLDNEVMNFLNTAVGAVSAVALSALVLP